MTAPTYLGALQAFSAYEPRYDELRPEDGNRTPQSYARGGGRSGGRVKFAYVVPSFANPTGETLSLAARERLLDLAAELDIPVIEDAAYAALRFEGERAAADHGAGGCAARQHRQRRASIYCGTFSKVLSPGLRVGWIVAPQAADPPPRAGQAGLRPQQLHHQPDGHAPPGGDGLSTPKSSAPARTTAAAATPCWRRSRRTCPRA